MATNERIDVHHHYVPEQYKEAVIAAGGDPSSWEIPKWTKETDIQFAQKYGVKTSLLSLTAPGACIVQGAVAQAKLARHVNEFAAVMRDQEPTKYGILAALPSLTYKQEALEELTYALDVLKADGVLLFTRYGTGHQYLGHPEFQYMWAELEKRKAVVLIHPTHPVDTNLVNPKMPQPVIDYPLETTRAAVDLLVSRTKHNHPNVKIILSHAGGTLPYLIGRPATVMPYLDQSFTPEEMLEDARDFYFDTAVAGSDNVLLVIERFAKPGHVLYGSDYPYAGPGIITYHTDGLDAWKFQSSSLLEAINKNNALKIFPRLAALQ